MGIAEGIIAAIVATMRAVPYFDKWMLAIFNARLESAKKDHAKDWAEAKLRWRQGGDPSGIEEAQGGGTAGKPATRPDGLIDRPEGGWQKIPSWLILAITAGLLSGCITRKQIDANMFKHDALSAELCGAAPENFHDTCAVDGGTNPNNPWCFGINRTVECRYIPDRPICQGKPPGAKFQQYQPYCDTRIKNYLGIFGDDYIDIVEKYTKPEGKKR